MFPPSLKNIFTFLLTSFSVHPSLSPDETLNPQTLDGRAYKSVDKQWTFTIELLQDWGAASSLFEAMWADAEAAPNTALNVSFTAVTGAVFAFTVLPIFPTAGGAAPGALTDTWTMTVIGTPTETFS